MLPIVADCRNTYQSKSAMCWDRVAFHSLTDFSAAPSSNYEIPDACVCVDKTIALPTADVMQHEADCEKASDADIRSGQAMPTEMQTCKTENDEKWP